MYFARATVRDGGAFWPASGRAHQRSRRVRLPAKLGHDFFERREDVPGDDEKRISDGTSSANLRINPPVGFLPYFFRLSRIRHHRLESKRKGTVCDQAGNRRLYDPHYLPSRNGKQCVLIVSTGGSYYDKTGAITL